MIRLSIITVYKEAGDDLFKTEESVLREFGASEAVEYIQKEWSGEEALTEESKRIGDALDCRLIRGEDSGVFDGMLQALEYATGEWVLFLNAGDWLADGFAGNLWQATEKATDCGYLYFDGVTVDCHDGREFLRSAPDSLKIADFMHQGPVLHPCLVVRRDAMLRYGFDLKLDLAADFDLMVRLVSDQVVALHVPEIGAYVVSGGLSEQRRVRARRQATSSLWRHRGNLREGCCIWGAFIRFLLLHFLITGIVYRMPALRKWLHVRREKQRA
jgi:hypothetical protein